jgi:hypothetical protein
MARKKSSRAAARNLRRPLKLKAAWKETRRALRSAEANVERRVAALVRQSGFKPREVMRQAEEWRVRLDREGKRARKRVAAGLVELQQRARRDRRMLAHRVDQAVARALAALNIPSRHELQQLSRRVEQLTARVGSGRR